MCQAHVQFMLESDLVRWRFVHILGKAMSRDCKNETQDSDAILIQFTCNRGGIYMQSRCNQ